MPTDFYLAISALLFIIGVLGVLIRRNAIIIFMCIEMMLNAANLAFIAGARQKRRADAAFAQFAFRAAQAGRAVEYFPARPRRAVIARVDHERVSLDA